MTKKSVKKEVKTSRVKEKKLTLYDAVQKNPTRNYIIVGALSKAGLLEQYYEEKEKHGVEVVKPSITESELEKIIKNFTG
ncbi:MAG: hypothetical protein Q4P18_07230 [Methanobrevibacter sp.]|uniref:hypothetical protein n=1 Tax=Methanobrevibacter sp. TaxID=66852 RepID=UPI0026E009CD|nr:hypothetical protein [Methanobrevibacter sp.]MDO5849310.1 hypothetical protein [Methanobrevibacter sp.]